MTKTARFVSEESNVEKTQVKKISRNTKPILKTFSLENKSKRYSFAFVF
uniref:Uncharacterized protein n=1 Tax=Chlorella vulgaris TaxID=3077 RepID=V9H0Y9_CHLVU|nr:hypothetical protein ChvulCp118 [Chlorella vulgaris]pir/T07305/ hypothetical protein 48d - Chlorella vulgaris chloroplast [Chlorella vulgaris]BAA57953.1 unnamed protein product [Chlorella vulgaris]